MAKRQLTIIIALLFVIFLLSLRKPEARQISEISVKDVGKEYLFAGNAAKIAVSETVSIYNFSQGNDSIRLVFFKPVALKGFIEIEAVVDFYEGQLELVGS